ncbi:DNA/RNA helicase domain-containing protein [Salisediminibacterium beveridgei]|uniref:AAA ATPase n=1 Tax=Salisediminibacterium beveridgei TaxID=632773 RepID=A0A1D7QWZ1_9BACI|nr:DNA/RNA helicase domain-containing protein [Salisediminibacterium beveridgei]AOM83534.1 AAA ATPase [Salisediminibacterium beveridgei]
MDQVDLPGTHHILRAWQYACFDVIKKPTSEGNVMIIYNEPSNAFIAHVLEQRIEDVLLDKVKEKINHSVSGSEIRSWTNSLPQMAKVIRDADLASDTHVLLEYKLPSSEKRIDFLITGENEAGIQNALIVELKQWQKSQVADGDGIVKTFLGKGIRETVHPSYQSLSYQRYLENFNEALYDDTSIQLSSCSYLHNYIQDRHNEPLLDDRYQNYLRQSPVYFQFDDRELTTAIKEKVANGKGADIASRIEHGRIRPSKKLVESVQSLLEGNEEFILLDEQKVAYEKVLAVYQQADLETAQKEVVLIKGGPGTGKSVIGLNLMNDFLKDEANVEYITPNQSFREILKKKLVGRSGFTEVRNLFKGSGSYTQTPENYFDVLICDEAHRLKNQGHMQKKIEGENQATQIMRASKISVFFIDDEQMISKKDIGNVKLIQEEAEKQGAILHEVELDSQFRCGGSGNFLEWLDNVLFEQGKDIPLEGDFDFQLVDSPNELYDKVVEEKDGRLVAGYAWEWNKELVNGELPKDVAIEAADFAMPWNDPNRIDWAFTRKDGNRLAASIPFKGSRWVMWVSLSEMI